MAAPATSAAVLCPGRAEAGRYVRQELEENTDIEAFCKTFLDIFADKFTTAVAQKKTALRLWCIHKERKVITASINLPADELELFELAWNAEALARCRGCKGEVAGVRAGPLHVRKPYCSERCRVGGMQVVCSKCKKPAALESAWYHCEACGGPPPLKTRNVESSFDQTLNRHAEGLTRANNMYRFEIEPKEEGDAKRRKRETEHSEHRTGSLLYRGKRGWRK